MSWRLFKFRRLLRRFIESPHDAIFWDLVRRVRRVEQDRWFDNSASSEVWMDHSRRLKALEDSMRTVALQLAKNEIEGIEKRHDARQSA